MWVGYNIKALTSTNKTQNFHLSLSFSLFSSLTTKKNKEKISTIIIRNHDVLDATMWFPVFQCFST